MAARGIHVTGVRCVVHFDLPADDKDYVHRSGRTGRAGADGVVVSLVAAAQRKDAARLRHALGLPGATTAPDSAALAGAGPAEGPPPLVASADPSERSAPSPRRPVERPRRTARPAPARRPAARVEHDHRSTDDRPRAPRPTPVREPAVAAGPSVRDRAGDHRSGPAPAKAGAKERPSGAARRKAKKAALIRAGVNPTRDKGRSGRGSRSGSPRSGRR